MKKGSPLIILLALGLATAAINFLVARHPLRIDLTQKHLYTLSDSTKKILAGLDDVVTVRLYFTRELPPALQVLRRDVDDLLSEFKSKAGRKFEVESVDPGAAPADEQRVQMMGIPPVQLNVVEKDKQEVAKIYLGMAVLFGGKQQVIPVVRDVGNLEYDLAEAIVKVSQEKSPKIAWWEPGRKELPEGDGFKLVIQEMERRYEIDHLEEKSFADLPEKKIEKKYAAVVLASPRTMSPDELAALDQYLMNGGALIALIDRAIVNPGLSLTPVETNAIDLLKRYGAEVEPSLVLDQSSAMAAFSGGVVTYHLPYPYWPEVRRESFSKENPITAGLESLVMPWTSPISLAEHKEDEIHKSVVLARSSSLSSSIPVAGARLDPQSAGDWLRASERKEMPLAVLVEGATGAAGARVLVVGSSRWISDRVVQTFPQNAAFFENALDAFAMGDALIGIRSREEVSRPIEILSDSSRALIKYLNLAAGPTLLVMIALGVVFMRRRREALIKEAYGLTRR